MTHPTQDDARRQLLDLLAREAYFEEKIVLSSGKTSDYYIDARRVTLHAGGTVLCARVVLDLIADLDPNAIGGPTLGADPMIGAISVLRCQEGRAINTFLIRKAPKAHGRQQQVEGPLLEKGARVILIDDVATTGKAFVQSLEVLEPLGVEVIRAVCLVDRGEGAKEAVAARGCELVAAFEVEEIRQRAGRVKG